MEVPGLRNRRDRLRLSGIGQARDGRCTAPHVAAVEEVKHLVIGRDPREAHAIWNELYRAGYLDITPAMSGVEMACRDILGKSNFLRLFQPGWKRRTVAQEARGSSS